MSLDKKLSNFLLQKQDVLKYSIQSDYTDFVGSRSFWREYFQIAKLTREHGHGGIILIVPSNYDWKKSIESLGSSTLNSYEKAKKSIQSLDEIWSKKLNNNKSSQNKGLLLNIFPSDEEKIQEFEEMKIHQERERVTKHSEKYLATISQLAAIDGATIIGYDFSVFTFGAKIKKLNKEAADNIVIKFVESFPFENDSENKEAKPITKYRRGTRVK